MLSLRRTVSPFPDPKLSLVESVSTKRRWRVLETSKDLPLIVKDGVQTVLYCIGVPDRVSPVTYSSSCPL